MQRVYVNADIHNLAQLDCVDVNAMRKIVVSLLVEDESAHCCVLRIPLTELLHHGFASDSNDETAVRWRLQNLCKMESHWYQFGSLQIEDKADGDYNEGIQSLLMQFESMYLVGTGSNGTSSNTTNLPRIFDELEDSKVECFGRRLKIGDFMESTKMYYQYQHFSTEQDQMDHLQTFSVHNEYLRRLQMHHFRCSKLHRLQPPQLQHSAVQYQESALFELWEIRRYLDRFWAIRSVSTRISVAVRIVSKSMVFDNMVFITDNSLLISDVNGIRNVNAVPLVIDCVDTFSMICDFRKMDNVTLLEQQPLAVLRDIAFHFADSRLELRFDEYSMIDIISDIDLRKEQRLFSYRSASLLSIEEYSNTPWRSCSAVMLEMDGEVEMVTMNDGFDPRCTECRKVTERYFKMMQSMVGGSGEDAEGMACTQCLKDKGEVRMIVQRGGALDVLVVCAVNIWFEDGDGNGIKRAIQWTEGHLHIDEVLALRSKLAKLVKDENESGTVPQTRGLKQCVIEYVRECDKKGRGSVDRVDCFKCFCCVI